MAIGLGRHLMESIAPGMAEAVVAYPQCLSGGGGALSQNSGGGACQYPVVTLLQSATC
jgi:hypothetical protein